ncbi:MAG: Mov34/MPN/PAD-1 family protein [Anaerolineales bacterium]
MEGIRVSPEQLQQMLEHVAQDTPVEACGLLGGSRSRVEQVVPIKNATGSPVRFRMDPAEQIQALFGFEERGLELIAIYHSHPAGPPGPSKVDLSEAAYPETVQLIWFQEEGDWICRAYRYEDGGAVEVALTVGSGKEEHGSQDQ